MKNNKAIFTLAIGQRYVDMWNKYCKSSWEPYAQKHGYDIVLVTGPVRTDEFAYSRTPHWQKCLILETEEAQKYEHVVWMDADILINFNTAPCIVSETLRLGADIDGGGIGLVSDRDSVPPDYWDNGYSRMVRMNQQPHLRRETPLTFAEHYERAGLPGDLEEFTNTGVLCFNHSHRPLLTEIYETGKETPFTSKENVPLSYHLLKSQKAVRLDARFNRSFDLEVSQHHPYFFLGDTKIPLRVLYRIANTAYLNNYFLHFVDGVTRGMMQMVMPGATFPDVFAHIDARVPDDTFIVGVHSFKI